MEFVMLLLVGLFAYATFKIANEKDKDDVSEIKTDITILMSKEK